MLYWLHNLTEYLGVLRLFQYLTFRSGGAFLTAFALTVFLGPWMVRRLKEFRATAPNRYGGEHMPKELVDEAKDRTPSMGGILIIGAVLISAALWMQLSNPVTVILIVATFLFSLIGFADDFAKVAYRRRDGIPGKVKLLGQFLVAGTAVLCMDLLPEYRNYMHDFMVPFLQDPLFTGWIVLPFSMIVIVGASNAVNLTDGKDGLAAGCAIFCVLAYAVFAYLCSNNIYSSYLGIPYISVCSEATVFSAALIGGCIGFLWHNCHPAAMFMGDTGSLAIGGAIGILAVMVRQEVLLVLVGGVFVMEALSVILQVTSFKLTGRRIFRCTPIHHHFEMGGWTETQIVVRFWILSGIFALMALGTLKLR